MTHRPNVATFLFSTIALSAAVALVSPDAFAAQSNDQQRCINAINKSGGKVAATQGKENSACIKDAGSGNLEQPTTDACVIADPKLKVSKAEAKTTDAFNEKCGDTPDFAYTSASAVNTAATDEEIALLTDIFGSPVHSAILVDNDGAKCQSLIAKTYEKLAATRIKAFNSCKKEGLKSGTISTGIQLQSCMSNDPKQKVAGAVFKLNEAVPDFCADVTLATAFPGCSAEAASAPALSACVARKTECRMCLFVNAADGIVIPCDAHDDGIVNQTCRQCGNGAAEAPEPCDTAGDSPTCDFDCTLVSCGDGHTNVPAGEACDASGQTAGCDDDCSLPSCGDGNLNESAGEVCDDGNLTDGDGCDSNCTLTACGNGIPTGLEACDDGNVSNNDTCLNTCVLATCGDTFTCSSVGCTSGPSGGVEACDDANLTDTDSCRNNCALAACSDGVVCNSPGCTTGPGGGLEQCDNAGANSNVTPDACRTNCANPTCGDSVADTGEACDDGNASNTDSCRTSCVLAICGDGITCSAMSCTTGPTGGAENCDDGNGANNDACRTNCASATCGDGILCNAVGCTTGPSGGIEQCDNGGSNSNVTPNACRTTCRPAFCGDTVVDAGETCDGGGVNTMTCDNNCTSAVCGDGFINTAANETCDGSGETVSCDANCTARVCGDGTINATAGELCDDGNATSGDGCSSTCQSGPGSGEQAQQCPDSGELILFSKLSNEVCANNGDCTFPRFCDATLLRCTTVADLDTGWNGAGHDADINDQIKARASLLCEGPASPGCGECEVLGLDPSAGNCRCSNNILTKCDQPFQVDANDCGAGTCNCWFGAPFPLAAQGTPVCVSNRFSADISGTANPDLGSGEITANLRAQVFSGHTTDMPCPVCGGKCSNDNSGCIFDSDCDGGATCVQDTPGDGLRNGLCVYDENEHTSNGVACDVDGTNASFPGIIGDATPGEGGGGYSIDCQPEVGKIISGQGLIINLLQTTGTTSLTSGLDCDAGGVGTDLCPCMVCSGDQTYPCDSNADCGALTGSCAGAPNGGGVPCTSNSNCTAANIGPCNNLMLCAKKTSQGCSSNTDCLNQNVGPCNLQTCTSDGTGPVPQPNFCSDDICTDQGNGEGACMAGPSFKYCDGLVKADGQGINSCLNDASCAGGYGTCTLLDPADCFLNPIVATGSPDPEFPVAGAVFCVPPSTNTAVNDAAGLPGPGRVISQASARTFCASNNAVDYNPGGVPACP